MSGREGSKVTKLVGISVAALLVVSALGLMAVGFASGPSSTVAPASVASTSVPAGGGLRGQATQLASMSPFLQEPAAPIHDASDPLPTSPGCSALPAGSRIGTTTSCGSVGATPGAQASSSAASVGPAVAVPGSSPSVGNGNDWYADAPSGNVIGVVTGTFPAETGVTSEVSATGPGGGPACPVGTSNCYGLQINTNDFPTTYASSGGPISTTGSEQYVYQESGSSAFMGIWVILYGFTSCPSPSPSGFSSWDLDLGNCYAHTPFVSVPAVPVTDLSAVTMTAYANQSGSDALVFCVNPAISGWPVCTGTSASDAIGLSYAWTVAEFNVFGDNGGSQAAFNGGAALQVQTQIATDGGGALVPTCAGAPGVHTVENNNLYLWPCSASSGGILFWEANESYGLSVTPATATVQAGQPVTYSVGFTGFSGVPAPVQLVLASPLPAGVTTSFPVTVTPPTAGLLNLTTSPTTPLGDYTLVVQAEIASLVGDPNPGPIATTEVSLHVYNFTVTISPSSATVVRGVTAAYTVELGLDPGSTVVGVPPIVLAVSGLPGDASASAFNPSGYVLSSPSPTTVPLTVQTAPAPSGSLGDFPFSVTATAQGYPAGATSASATLHIFDFTVGLSPAAESLPQGASTTMTVSVGLLPGSTTFDLPSVSLTLTGVPSGVVAVGFPTSLPIGSSQAFTLETSTVGAYISCPHVSSHGGQDLRHANLAHCDLAGYNLRGDNLQYANLSGADLAGANLSGDNLRGADLASANTSGANFYGDNMQDVDLSAAGPLGVFEIVATGSVDGVSRLGASNLTVLGDQISGDTFFADNLRNANLTGDVAVGTQFKGDSLGGATLARDDLAGATFAFDDLSFADLAGADLAGATLFLDNMPCVDLAGADLVGANAPWNNLVLADLAGADLQGANLQFDNLGWADLVGATLTGLGPATSQLTNFNWANLERANLTGAVCGSPNYISAFGTNTHGLIGVPAACTPPLDPEPGFFPSESSALKHDGVHHSRTESKRSVDVRTPTTRPAAREFSPSGAGATTVVPFAVALTLYLGATAGAIAAVGGFLSRRSRIVGDARPSAESPHPDEGRTE